MTTETGEPAFPTENERQTGHTSWQYEGMTLRDYFAAKAPSVPDDFGWADGERSTWERQVRWNYFYADLMIAERNKE